MQEWPPLWGAIVKKEGIHFTVWAPEAKSLEVIREQDQKTFPLYKDANGVWTACLKEFNTRDLYRYRIDAKRVLPDPASRFQPNGVHDASQIIDPKTFIWTDQNWHGASLKDAIIYELHVGSFTDEGTFAAAAERLPYLQQLGITCIELMPVADFPGNRNWGYDGVTPFAPARCYGDPDDLRKFVDTAHRFGIAVLMDVVYNHFGPDGAYAPSYSHYYFTNKHKTPWGDAINLDGKYSSFVRNFFIENALYWIHEFHMDGLRLDATHAIVDDSEVHFLKELATKVKNTFNNRKILLIPEDHRNLTTLIQSNDQGGFELDAVWSDDFHHQIQKLLTGESDGYYCDFRGEIQDLLTIIRKGWLFCGQHSEYFGGARGS
ncbi:MAG TPA: alpha-amylase family glycosyl hydrolase, partial [Acidobacteriota bacterium]